jgi:adenosylcobinamide kinase/adenosylcobinamide-phosphate guanylyltransferase
MGKLILVLGGARSGKSSFAQRLAQERAGERVLYVATAEAKDDEMQARIANHRASRPAGWDVLELPTDVGLTLRSHTTDARVILVDCLTLLISNRLVAHDDPFAPEIEAQVNAEVEALVACAKACPADLIIVSNEVGMGLVPPYPVGRAYRDLVGRANQELASQADAVYFLVAGLPMTLK